MSKRRLGQAVFWLFLFSLLNYGISLQSDQGWQKKRERLEDRIETGITDFIVHSAEELCPALFYNEETAGLRRLVTGMERGLEEVILPSVSYCKNYWEDRSYLKVGSDKVPAYFLESDVEKEEKFRNISAETTGMERHSRFYTKKQLEDYEFLLKNCYTVDSTTRVTKEELQGKKLAAMDLSIPLDGKEPKILIYHTHGCEDFIDSRKGKKEDTVIGVGDELASILEEKYKISVYHDRSVYDMINGVLDRSKAYTYSGNGVAELLRKYPSIEVIIDLHRDAVGGNTRLVTELNGKSTAKIMFFNGMSRTAKNGEIGYLRNPNKVSNLAFSLQMFLSAAEKFPGFTRKIYLKGYRYNLHLKPRSTLIEAGAQTNTVQEVKNAMGPLAEILYTVLKSDEES